MLEEPHALDDGLDHICRDWISFKSVFQKIFHSDDEDQNFLYRENACIVLKDAYKELSLGLEDTAVEQSRMFYEIIKRESKRSKAFRELIYLIYKERVDDKNLLPLDFLVGKNCCAFIDSAGNQMTEIRILSN